LHAPIGAGPRNAHARTGCFSAGGQTLRGMMPRVETRSRAYFADLVFGIAVAQGGAVPEHEDMYTCDFDR